MACKVTITVYYHVHILVSLKLNFQEIKVFYTEYIPVVKLVDKRKASPFTKATSTTGASISFPKD